MKSGKSSINSLKPLITSTETESYIAISIHQTFTLGKHIEKTSS